MKSFQTSKCVALCFLVISLFFSSYVFASGDSYPQNGWQISTPEKQGIRSDVLCQMIEHIEKNSFHIDSISVVRNGYLVFDAYFWPFKQGEKHKIHSCTKSIMSALIGIAIDKGYIKNVNQPITDFFPDKTFAHKNSLKKKITLKDLLMMASGLKCQDSYLYLWVGLRKMRKSADWAKFVLNLPMAFPPGEKFEYCNGVSYLLSVIIQNTTKIKTLDFAEKYLLHPIGITDIGWAISPQGVYIGWGEMRLKPHDMAKFGWLFLNNGRWQNKQVVPAWWVKESTKGHIKTKLSDQYGYQWWKDYRGYYMAVGFKGQRIFVVPQKNMVVVFCGDLFGKERLAPTKLLNSYIIPAASSTKPLSANKEDQLRLTTLVNKVSKEPKEGFIWTTKSEGVAKDGVFKRTATPAFQFRYPLLGSKKSGLNYPGQVMRMKTLKDIDFFALVDTIPKGVDLKDFGPKVVTAELKKFGSKIEVILNKEITLKCGTKAYRTDILWMAGKKIPIRTMLVSAYKNGKVVFVSVHPYGKAPKYETIIQSLTFR